MIKSKLFGTDGIREKISSEILSVDKVARLGQVLGSLLEGSHKKRVLIAYDTRASSIYLSKALESGLLSMGIDVEVLGVLTTPALSYLTKGRKADLGIMISASHNPAEDNGFKIFDHNGSKIDRVFEHSIEELFFSTQLFKPASNMVGTLRNVNNYESDYISFLLKQNLKLEGLQNLCVVVDCAHGAASFLAKELFARIEANVIFLNNQPDGTNINENAGSEHPEQLIDAVLRHNADVGIAFDGDADRVLFVDGDGNVVDGDAILYALAIELKSRNMLENDTLVATVMSNKGLDLGLKSHNINVVRADVGDRNVANMMKKGNYVLGGENSGHIIFGSFVATGDGLLSALFVLSFVLERGVTLKEWCKDFQKIPSVLLNIEVKQKYPLETLNATRNLLDTHNDLLANDGRILMRYSGTQMLMRLFVESPSEALCRKIAEELRTTFEIECQNL